MDGQDNCFDKTDEFIPLAMQNRDYVFKVALSNPPSLINMDGVGNYSAQKLASVSECPETHFICPDGMCLPVYLRCNGVYDCIGKVDEADCQEYTCPGYYRFEQLYSISWLHKKAKGLNWKTA